MKHPESILLVAAALSGCGDAPSTDVPTDPGARDVRACSILPAREGEAATKLCRIYAESDWTRLDLHAGNRRSERVRSVLATEIGRTEARANYYVTFTRSPPSATELRLADREGWYLEAVLRSSATKAECAVSWDAERLLGRFGRLTEGQGEAEGTDPSDGKRCGNIALIHSLLRLGVLTESDAFQGEHLNEALVRRVDRFHDADGGMTPDQQRAAYAGFSTPGRSLECTTAGMTATTSEDQQVSRVGATLKLFMDSTDPVYDCSLALYGDRQPNGEMAFRHVEHVKRVTLGESGEHLVETVDGLNQGTGAGGIPKDSATNTWGLGRNWIQFKTSTSPENKRRYSEIPRNRLDARCCHVRKVN